MSCHSNVQKENISKETNSALISQIQKSVPYLSLFITNLPPHLSVLPSSSLSRVGSNSAETQASIVELHTLQSNIHLPRIVVRRASNETTMFVRKVPERLALGQVPAGLDIALRDSSRVGDGVLDLTGGGLDVDFLATGDDDAHAEGVLAAGKSGEVAGRAGTESLDVLGAVGGGGLVEPDGLARGGEGLVVDGRGRAGGGQAEVLSRGGRDEASDGGEGGGGLHVGGCVWLLVLRIEEEW